MAATATEQRIERQRWRALEDLTAWLEPVMVVLALAWLALLVVELIWGLTPVLEIAVTAIWVVFILEFAARVVIAPDRPRYILRNWFTVIALIVPALRIFRVLTVLRAVRLSRAARSLRIVRLVTSLNRGMKSLALAMGRRGLGYLAILTVVVVVVGAAGMYAFEEASNETFNTYWEALWWTAMIITTLGSQGWPESAEGRILGFLLALYAFIVFGYVAGALASLLIERDTGRRGVGRELDDLRAEVRTLREFVGASMPDTTSATGKST